MLVLSRKRGERIQIGPDVTITVVRIEGDKVRIGIAAPRELPIDRVGRPGARAAGHKLLPAR